MSDVPLGQRSQRIRTAIEESHPIVYASPETESLGNEEPFLRIYQDEPEDRREMRILFIPFLHSVQT